MRERRTSGVCSMPSTREILDAIVRHINESDIEFANWCIGVTADSQIRLFNDLGVGKDIPRIFKDTGSEEAAMSIREYLIETYGTRGNAWNGEGTARYVYAYAVTGKNG